MTFKSQTTSSINFEGLHMKLIRKKNYAKYDVYFYGKPMRLFFQCKIEKVPRGIRSEKSSKDMASSRNLVSTIGALASPKMGDGTRCPEG